MADDVADDVVLAANRAFYSAFEARDIDAMSDLWEHSDRAVCVHPGWARLSGWAAISASFFALFQNGQQLQFILTGEKVDVVGDTAWVSVDENILSDEVGGTVAALNVFVRGDGGGVWWSTTDRPSSIARTSGASHRCGRRVGRPA